MLVIQKSFKQCFNDLELRSIEQFTTKISKELGAEAFLNFAEQAIKSREYVKLQFSKILQCFG